ncbi:ribonuclease H-like protein [Violaceomyces palustris]|uniref:Ribonuclease H-like protein n=1 Tax=Violaceomyces palustris TaxID=1673888 RepID=A0ACD0NZQ2_9BASI|nr:ribonuclease H-like protein [Violaceomyces palustris]
MPPKKPSFYAVKVGKVPGIYGEWSQAKAQVDGHPGALHKKFASLEEAQHYISGQALHPSSNTAASQTNFSPEPAFSINGSGVGVDGSIGARGGKRLYENVGEQQVLAHPLATSSSRSIKRKRISDAIPSERIFKARDLQAPKGVLRVYCDGSSQGNGGKRARAGWGVFWEDENLSGLNEARRLPGEHQTNNRAELMAIIRAIQLCPDPDAELQIYTDSQYAISAITQWQGNWRAKGWKLSTGEPVMNKDLIRRLERELRKRKIRPKLIKVKGHDGIYGNEMADMLANQGASLPEVEGEVDLEPSPSEEESPKRAKKRAPPSPNPPSNPNPYASQIWSNGLALDRSRVNVFNSGPHLHPSGPFKRATNLSYGGPYSNGGASFYPYHPSERSMIGGTPTVPQGQVHRGRNGAIAGGDMGIDVQVDPSDLLTPEELDALERTFT